MGDAAVNPRADVRVADSGMVVLWIVLNPATLRA